MRVHLAPAPLGFNVLAAASKLPGSEGILLAADAIGCKLNRIRMLHVKKKRRNRAAALDLHVTGYYKYFSMSKLCTL